jgi:hypothetical protein
MQAKRIAYEVCKMAFGDGSSGGTNNIDPLNANDPFADVNTQIV